MEIYAKFLINVLKSCIFAQDQFSMFSSIPTRVGWFLFLALYLEFKSERIYDIHSIISTEKVWINNSSQLWVE